MSLYGQSKRRTIFAGDAPPQEETPFGGVMAALPGPGMLRLGGEGGGSFGNIIGDAPVSLPSDGLNASEGASETIQGLLAVIADLRRELAARPRVPDVVQGVIDLTGEAEATATLRVLTHDAFLTAIAAIAAEHEAWREEFAAEVRRDLAEVAALVAQFNQVMSLFGQARAMGAKLDAAPHDEPAL